MQSPLDVMHVVMILSRDSAPRCATGRDSTPDKRTVAIPAVNLDLLGNRPCAIRGRAKGLVNFSVWQPFCKNSSSVLWWPWNLAGMDCPRNRPLPSVIFTDLGRLTQMGHMSRSTGHRVVWNNCRLTDWGWMHKDYMSIRQLRGILWTAPPSFAIAHNSTDPGGPSKEAPQFFSDQRTDYGCICFYIGPNFSFIQSPNLTPSPFSWTCISLNEILCPSFRTLLRLASKSHRTCLRRLMLFLVLDEPAD